MTKREKEELYNTLLRQQYGVCAICGDPPGKRKFAIDHDHKTDKVRGLLCFKCNVAVGFLRDDPNLMLCASKYIDEDRWEAEELKELNKAWHEKHQSS